MHVASKAGSCPLARLHRHPAVFLSQQLHTGRPGLRVSCVHYYYYHGVVSFKLGKWIPVLFSCPESQGVSPHRGLCLPCGCRQPLHFLASGHHWQLKGKGDMQPACLPFLSICLSIDYTRRGRLHHIMQPTSLPIWCPALLQFTPVLHE